MPTTTIPESALTPFLRRRGDGRVAHTDPALAMTSFTWLRGPRRYAMTTVAKATFSLEPGTPASLNEETLPFQNAQPVAGESPHSSICHPNDFAPIKHQTDVVAFGHAHSTRPTSAMEVQFRFGRGSARFARSLMVFGDRHWHTRAGVTLVPSEPRPFQRMPLVYERAFGGPGHAVNPIGLGYPAPLDLAVAGAALLPNIEDPRRRIKSTADEPDCVGFGAIPVSWPQRRRLLGEFDGDWLGDAWPDIPFDSDADYYQCAPLAQRLPLLHGDEPFEFVGMHPDRPRLRGSLPGLRPRCFSRAPDGTVDELPMQLDTVSFDLDAELLVLCWRCVSDVADADASSVNDLFGLLEPLGERGAATTRSGVSLERLRAEYGSPPMGRPGGEALSLEEADAVGQPLDDADRRPIDALRTDAARAALAVGIPLPRELMAVDLGGLDLSGQDLSWADLEHARLAGANLSCAKLEGARLSSADLRNCDLSGADLSQALMHHCDLRDADLRGARLDDCDMSHSCVQRARFERATGSYLTLEECDLRHSVFEEASLDHCQLLRSNLDHCNFSNARIDNVCMYQSRGEQVVFDQAHMSGARLDEAVLQSSSFAAMRAPQSFWVDAVVAGSSFVGAHLQGANLMRVGGDGCRFSGADLREARLSFAQLHQANLAGADLMDADLDDACIARADLRGCNLYGCSTLRSNLQGANLDGSDLRDTAATRTGRGTSS